MHTYTFNHFFPSLRGLSYQQILEFIWIATHVFSINLFDFVTNMKKAWFKMKKYIYI